MANLPADLVTAARQFETGDAATIQILGALADEIDRFKQALAAQTIAVLQAQHERDCAIEKLAELRAELEHRERYWAQFDHVPKQDTRG